MSGVWVFKGGVVRSVKNPPGSNDQQQGQISGHKKVLLHIADNEVITSYASLETKLRSLGWERYYGDPEFFQFHKISSLDLISLPKDFSKFNPVHMYDIVVKNRNSFEVKDM